LVLDLWIESSLILIIADGSSFFLIDLIGCGWCRGYLVTILVSSDRACEPASYTVNGVEIVLRLLLWMVLAGIASITMWFMK
jgi:hypothetical protein